MNVLKESNMNVINFLGGFQRRSDNVKYRWNSKIISTEYDEGVILYNGITGAVVSLFDFEYDNVFTELPCDYVGFLHENYFFVREDFDEMQIIKDFRHKLEPYMHPNYLETPTHFVILTTTKCNARCPYCYENTMNNKHDMSEQTAKDIVKYIVEHANRNSTLGLEWFGGEPLTNTKVIDIITSGVRSAGFDIDAKMVSNGYLFNEDLVNRAFYFWNIRHIQITLDGYGEQYNKTKRYIYKDDPNPFATVIQNIHNLLKIGIQVTIRLNCGLHNYKNLIELIKYLGEEFKGERGLSMYVWEIFTDNPRPENEAEIYFDCLDQVDKAICESGIGTPEYLEPGIKAEHCIVDNGNGTVINVDGKLCLCEHYLEDDFYGDIYNHGHFDRQNFENWRTYVKNYEGICVDCPNQAGCLKMSRCTDRFICTKPEQKYVLNKIKRRMLNLFKLSMMLPQKDICQQNNCICCNQD